MGHGRAGRGARCRRAGTGVENRQRPDRRQQPQPQDAGRRPCHHRTARPDGAQGPRAGGRERPGLAGRPVAHGQGRRLGLPDRRKFHAPTRRRGGRARDPGEGGMSRKKTLTHFDERGNAHMVDVGGKDVTERIAVARASVIMQPATLKLIATKKAAKVDVKLTLDAKRNAVDIEATCRLKGRTGVEMEALTAASVAALTVYDMCKSVDRGMVISDVRLLHKSGGKSGTYNA